MMERLLFAQAEFPANFIDEGWFRCVTHEFYRNGRRRYESRYLLTWRGINHLIDLAVTKKLVLLPCEKPILFPRVIA